MTRMLRTALLVALAAVPPAAAEELVYFRNGRAMRVEKTRHQGQWLYLSLGSEQEMGVLLRQVKKVEPAEPLPQGSRDASVAPNLVAGGGGGAAGYVPPAVAESYDATEVGEEPAVAAPVPPELQQQAMPGQGAPQGQELVPRTRRSGRFPRR